MHALLAAQMTCRPACGPIEAEGSRCAGPRSIDLRTATQQKDWALSPISRGFLGRRHGAADPARVPPGQYVTRDFPVLSAGPTPHVDVTKWTFTIDGAVDEAASWSWEQLLALPAEEITRDIHCVTKWSKLDTRW